jgi:hypothetical protein
MASCKNVSFVCFEILWCMSPLVIAVMKPILNSSCLLLGAILRKVIYLTCSVSGFCAFSLITQLFGFRA